MSSPHPGAKTERADLCPPEHSREHGSGPGHVRNTPPLDLGGDTQDKGGG